MSYIDHVNDPRRRAAAIAGVVAIHAALGAIVITGMTVAGFIKPDDANPVGFKVPLDPPPPAPSPTASADPVDSILTAPVPPIPLPPSPGPQVEPFDGTEKPGPVLPYVAPTPGPSLMPDPPRPLPAFTPRSATPANDQSRWVTTDDYPTADLMRGNEGTTRYRLSVGSNGRVTACDVLATSGSTRLDEAACKAIARRARFDPATDENGARVVGTFTGNVRWEIPD